MKKITLYALIAAAVALLPVSCKKESQPEPTPENPEHVHSLVHVEAVPHTEDENGCFEHWICEECGATFADEKGEEEMPLVIDWADDVIICPEDILAPFGEENDDMRQYAMSEDDDMIYGNFAAGLLSHVIVKTLTHIMDKAFESTHEEQVDPAGQIIYVINEKYMGIMKELGSIQKSIDALSDQIKNQVYKNAMQRRYEEQIALYNATDASFRQLMYLFDNKPYSQLSDEEKADISKLLDVWYQAPVKGNNVINEIMDMLDMSLMTFDTGTSYPEVYDNIAYQAYAFEHLGYNMRELIRAVDALTLAESYLMACMWMEINGSDRLFSERHQALNDKIQTYSDLLDAHPVERHTDYTVSQVKGFHEGRKLKFAFKKGKYPDDFIASKANDDWRCYLNDGYKKDENKKRFRELRNDMYKYIAGDDELATLEEYRALWEYYRGEKSIDNIFIDAGFTGYSEVLKLKTFYIPTYHNYENFSWQHFEYNGYSTQQGGAWFNMYFEMVGSGGTSSMTHIFMDNTVAVDSHNGHLNLGERDKVDISYPEWFY